MLTPSVISSQALTTNVVAFPFRPLHGLLSQEDPHHYGEFITLLLTSRQTLTHVIMSQNGIFMPTKFCAKTHVKIEILILLMGYYYAPFPGVEKLVLLIIQSGFIAKLSCGIHCGA